MFVSFYPLFLPFSFSFCIDLSVAFCLCFLFPYIFLPFSFSFWFSLSISVYSSFPLSLSFFLLPSLSFFLPFSFSFCISLQISVYVSPVSTHNLYVIFKYHTNISVHQVCDKNKTIHIVHERYIWEFLVCIDCTRSIQL